MSESGTVSVAGSTGQPAAHATDRSLVAEIMRRARHWFPHKPSFELAEIIGCDVRTAERYFAGDRTPGAEQLFSLLRSEHGVKLVEEATRDLPPAEHKKFWNEMARATLRASLRDTDELRRA